MEADFIFKIAGMGFLVTILTLVLNRAGREDISALVALSGLVIVLLMVLGLLSDFMTNVRAMLQF